MTAATALEAVMKHCRTKAEMVALMERYVLDFGREMSEKAKLSGQTSDPVKKQKLETDGLISSFVVSALNSVLVEIKK